jgi:2-polyprenyl-3-methyl-5-hydroxy-6-metoxy-1,4-benzoquinol methylase
VKPYSSINLPDYLAAIDSNEFHKMTENKPTIGDFWKETDTARLYEAGSGGVTKRITKDILALYLKSNSLEGKVVLDNACGTGIVTREILSNTDDITIEAADISAAMIDQLQQYLASEGKSGVKVKVITKVMNAEVSPTSPIFFSFYTSLIPIGIDLSR